MNRILGLECLDLSITGAFKMDISLSSSIVKRAFSPRVSRLCVWAWAIALGVPLPSSACGSFASKVDVIRPSTADALFAGPRDTRRLKVGDRFAVVLPPVEADRRWNVIEPSTSIAEAFKPTDESGSNVFAWRLIKPGNSFVMITEWDESSRQGRVIHIGLEVLPGWVPNVIDLNDANAGQTISFKQRDILKIRLVHPDNQIGYWRIDKGLSALAVQYGGEEAVRGRQVMNAERWLTEIDINTTQMPGAELVLSFRLKSQNIMTLFSRPVIFQLKGSLAPSC